MKTKISLILIPIIIVLVVAGLLLVIPSVSYAYAAEEDTAYYLNAEELFAAINAGEEDICLVTCVDEYDNELTLAPITFEELGFSSLGFALLFPEEFIVYYFSSDVAVPEEELYFNAGYNADNVDTTNGKLNIPFTVTSYNERFISTTPFDYSDGMPEFKEELSETDLTFVGFFEPFITFITSLAPVTQNIFDLLYTDGSFTSVGLVFIFMAGFGLALVLFNVVINLWRFND